MRIAAVATATLLTAGMVSACSSGGGGDKAESTTLNVTLANHVWTDSLKKRIPDFEKETGLKVVVNQLSEDQLADSYKVKLNAGSADVDVMMYRPLQVGKLFAASHYFVDLTKHVSDDATWNWSDFQPGPVSITTYQDKVVGVPIVTENEILYYRKDLLQKAGLSVPTTMDELQAAAKKIKEQNPGVAGFVSRTQASAGVTQFSGFLYSFGGDWMDADGTSTVGTDAAKKAYAYYGGLLRDYGPAQVNTDMSWPEAMALFQQGKAAFETDASSLYDNLANPEKSKVSDQVGYAAFPAGPAGSKPYNVAAWALGINSASKNQDNAWKFIKWATSPEMTLALQEEGNSGARTSVWENPAATAKFPAELVKAIAENGKNGIGYDRPLVLSVAQAREIVGAPFVAAITGGDSNAAADKANTEFQSLLDSEKK
ncbi:ABC transporter substrate-binding protein [Microbacterium terrisoli]|uniref:ABC transporter substrate-binding protein n=1 Tax=Microbacterium terrisoli TaxID=3242192 RepID=UPI00280649BE|nr:sugar ABC transporter substrate-binding protein [Microbacterium protaetiae]